MLVIQGLCLLKKLLNIIISLKMITVLRSIRAMDSTVKICKDQAGVDEENSKDDGNELESWHGCLYFWIETIFIKSKIFSVYVDNFGAFFLQWQINANWIPDATPPRKASQKPKYPKFTSTKCTMNVSVVFFGGFRSDKTIQNFFDVNCSFRFWDWPKVFEKLNWRRHSMKN